MRMIIDILLGVACALSTIIGLIGAIVAAVYLLGGLGLYVAGIVVTDSDLFSASKALIFFMLLFGVGVKCLPYFVKESHK
jgi:hypothetical protein